MFGPPPPGSSLYFSNVATQVIGCAIVLNYQIKSRDA